MTLHAVLLAGWLVAQGSPIVSPPAPSQNVTVRSEVTVQVPPPDPQATADMAAWSFEGIFINVIAPTLIRWTNELFDIPDFVRHTPPNLSYGNPGVKLVAETVRAGALVLTVLAFLVWGIAKMLGQQPSIARPFAAAALSAGNLIWWQIGIDLNNAINDMVAPPDLRSIVSSHLSLPETTSDPGAAFGPALLVVAYCLVTILLILSALFRLGLIDMLIAIGSLGLICAGSEYSQNFYSTYTRLSVSTLFSQVLMVAALRLAPILGIIGGGFIGALLGLVVLLLARRMPGMLASQTQRGSGLPGVGLVLLLRRAVARI